MAASWAASWIERMAQEVARNGPAVRITVIRAEGSTPRETGAAMHVGPNGTQDTIGGGALEFEAIAHARGLLAKLGEVAPAWQRQCRDFALGPSLGQCCGGQTRLLFEVFTARERPALQALALQAMAANCEPGSSLLLRPLEGGVPLEAVADRKQQGQWPLAVTRLVRDMLSGARPRQAVLARAGKAASPWFVEPLAQRSHALFIYGAGHVGRALVRAVGDLPFAVTWVDTSKARFPETIPAGVAQIATADPAAVAAATPGGALHVVMTYSHPLDLAICHSLLKRSDFAYLGLIGSATKRARFVKRLAEFGNADALLARLVCPIGIPGLDGKEPAIIAVSVAAQLTHVILSGPEGTQRQPAAVEEGSP
jgi:xanthine dehydrogenase accessory factor